MHSAPSVSYPVGRSRLQFLILLALWMLAAALTLLWWRQAAVPVGAMGASAVLVLLAGAGAFAHGWWSPPGELAWDGANWRWSHAEGACESPPLVVLDLQLVLVLRWHEGAMPGWLWLERTGSPARWADLRRAVYSRGRPDARAPASPP